MNLITNDMEYKQVIVRIQYLETFTHPDHLALSELNSLQHYATQYELARYDFMKHQRSGNRQFSV